MSEDKRTPGPRPIQGTEPAPAVPPPALRRSRFGAAAEGWEAYNTWLARVRQTGPTSRQAVISKALYSVSSYRSWADKARGAFEPEPPREDKPDRPK